MPGWVRKPGPPHKCAMPKEFRYGDSNGVGAVWRCHCRKLYVFREGWYFGEFPPWWHREAPQWYKARWWERLRWSGRATL